MNPDPCRESSKDFSHVRGRAIASLMDSLDLFVTFCVKTKSKEHSHATKSVWVVLFNTQPPRCELLVGIVQID
ncbi:MAG TPA: hypothetical protein VL947_10945, partial [Cytophagales bacterium]|nr:hypothetical protein [Cytophagales bacterium]